MLILTRRIGETLVCNDNGKLTEVTVLGVKGNQVRLGVTADKDVKIDREEIYQRKQAEKCRLNGLRTMTDQRKKLTTM